MNKVKKRVEKELGESFIRKIDGKHYIQIPKVGIRTLTWFFSKQVEKELARARKEERERIKANIGLLRQWLNERLEHDRLLTNEDLETWLLSKPIKQDKHE